MTTAELSTTIKSLVGILKDGELGFAEAARDVTRADLRELFRKYSLQRGVFGQALNRQMRMLDQETVDSGSMTGAVHRGWIETKAAVSTRDDVAVLEECERGEDAAVKAYRDALGDPHLDGAIREVVKAQEGEIQAAHDRIRALRDVSKATH